MSTQLTYRAAVKLRGYDAIPDATVDDAVQEGRRRVLTDRRWSFMESSNATISTVIGTSSISLATITDFGDLDAVRLADGTTPIAIRWRSRTIIRDLQDRCPTTGTPQFWTRIKGTVVFYPTPSRVLTVTVEYIPAPADLGVSPAIDVIPDKLRDLVVYAACVPLSFRQRDLAASSAADQYYSKVLLPRHAGQDGVEQRQSSEQVKSGYWRS